MSMAEQHVALTMGTKYAEAVRKCIGGFGTVEEDRNQSRLGLVLQQEALNLLELGWHFENIFQELCCRRRLIPQFCGQDLEDKAAGPLWVVRVSVISPRYPSGKYGTLSRGEVPLMVCIDLGKKWMRLMSVQRGFDTSPGSLTMSFTLFVPLIFRNSIMAGALKILVLSN